MFVVDVWTLRVPSAREAVGRAGPVSSSVIATNDAQVSAA